METCKLCLVSVNELQNSHIIPNAFWKVTKSKKGYKNGHYIEIAKAGTRFGQKSFSEKMLCYSCEQKLSINFEKYVCDLLLRNPANQKVTITKSKNSTTYKGIEYEKLKLFQCSILWRASISSLPLFSKVKLSESYEEELRRSILDLEPLPFNYFPCVMSRVLINEKNKTATGLISNPFTEKTNIFKKIVFYFGGVEWTFHIPTCSQFLIDEMLVPSKSNQKILVMPIKYLNQTHLNIAVAFAHINQSSGKGIDMDSLRD